MAQDNSAHAQSPDDLSDKDIDKFEEVQLIDKTPDLPPVEMSPKRRSLIQGVTVVAAVVELMFILLLVRFIVNYCIEYLNPHTAKQQGKMYDDDRKYLYVLTFFCLAVWSCCIALLLLGIAWRRYQWMIAGIVANAIFIAKLTLAIIGLSVLHISSGPALGSMPDSTWLLVMLILFVVYLVLTTCLFAKCAMELRATTHGATPAFHKL